MKGGKKMKPRNLEEVKREVKGLRDSLGMPVDAKIRDLVIGLRRWGVKTSMSCQGHYDRHPYPWVMVDIESPNDLFNLVQILAIWWQGKNLGHPRGPESLSWVIEAGPKAVKIMPEDKRARNLEEMQNDAIEFGRYLQNLPEDYFKE